MPSRAAGGPQADGGMKAPPVRVANGRPARGHGTKAAPARAAGRARRRTVEWLRLWDFAEPDAAFWVFADHGYQVAGPATRIDDSDRRLG